MEGLRTNYRRKLDSFDSLGSLPTIDPLLCFPPYIKKLYTIPDWPALTTFLKSHLWIFSGCTVDLFIYRMTFPWLNFMQLFLTKSSNGLTLKSLLFEFSGLFRESLSFTWRNFLNVSYRFSLIAMATRSYRNSGDQYILYWDILTIAIVIWIPKNTSVSLAFLFIDFPLRWTLYRFVWLAICSRILPSQNSLKYCNGVISAAFSGGGLSSFPLNEVSKTIASFFLHL